MPELPEIETIKRQLNKKIVGKVWQGNKILKVRRRAKMLIIDLADSTSLVFHLKLTGQLIYNGKPGKYTRQVFVFSDKSQLIFNDMRKFGWCRRVKNVDMMKEMQILGPEPFTVNFKIFQNLLAKRKRSRIKPLLMDQGFIAGIGNIYADEILFRAKVHPTRTAGSLSNKEIQSILKSIKYILTAAINVGGSSVKDYVNAEGKAGEYAKYHKVYRKTDQPCLICGTIIKRIKLGGRGTHFCPKCQK